MMHIALSLSVHAKIQNLKTKQNKKSQIIYELGFL